MFVDYQAKSELVDIKPQAIRIAAAVVGLYDRRDNLFLIWAMSMSKPNLCASAFRA